MNLLECEEENGGESRVDSSSWPRTHPATVKIQMGKMKTELEMQSGKKGKFCRFQVLAHPWALTLPDPEPDFLFYI